MNCCKIAWILAPKKKKTHFDESCKGKIISIMEMLIENYEETKKYYTKSKDFNSSYQTIPYGIRNFLTKTLHINKSKI